MTTYRTEVVPGLHVGDYKEAHHELRWTRRHLLVVCAETPGSLLATFGLGDPPPLTLFLPLVDDEEPMALRLQQATRQTARLVARLVPNQSVLITCERGLNRSALVAALALFELGRSPTEAEQLVRAARGPLALRNEQFLRMLHGEEVTGGPKGGRLPISTRPE